MVVVLSDRADGNAESMVEPRVEKSDVGTVCLGGERIIAVVDGPVLKEEI